MSARSMSRARERELSREQRRWGRRAKRASTGAAVALGAGIAFAPAADAANFTVNSNADGPADACDATCTLRDAIDAANADGVPDTITFAPSVTGQIVLDAGEGELPIYSSMTITGPGSGALAIDGNLNTQLFYVDTDSVGAPFEPVTITGLTLREGDAGAGAALYTYESATTLDAVEVRSNNSSDDGAVYMQGGSLNVSNSTFADNDAASDGGAIYTDDDNGPDTNGISRVVISNSTFVGNTTAGEGGAIYIDDETDSALITGTTVSGNTADGNGGGVVIFGVETGVARVEDSTITGNTAGDSGGGVYVYNQYDKPVEFVNSTIAANSAGTSGGGVYNYAGDLPEYAGAGDVTVSSTIVSGNNAPTAPDLFNRVYAPGDTPVAGTFLTGFSLIGNTTGAPITETPAGSNKLNVDPQLGALANNGGPTSTLLPAETSPVVDSGIANGLTVDQRGLPRTIKRTFTPAAGSDGTDIGAVELQDTALNGVTVKAKKNQKVKGKKVVVVVQVSATEPIEFKGSGSVKAGKAKAKLKPVTKTLAAGGSTKLKLKPKKKNAAKKVVKAIKGGKKGKAKISVVATDPAGNSQTSKPKVKLKG